MLVKYTFLRHRVCRSLQVRETEVYDQLWADTPVSTCGADVVEAFENTDCFEAACASVPDSPLLDDRTLFDYPEVNAAVNLLLWMVFYRLSMFEFNEMDTKRHALRRAPWAGLLWRFCQLFITASILVVGYVMELVIAGHAPEGLICPAFLAGGVSFFVAFVAVCKLFHTPRKKLLWPVSTQFFVQIIVAGFILLGPLFFPAPVVAPSAGHHRRQLEGYAFVSPCLLLRVT